MEVHFGPNSVDEPNLLYKLQRKIKVFNTNNNLTNRGYNLVTCSSKYGVVFVASPNGILSAYNLKELVDKECEPKHHSVKLQVEPTHISVNCDQEWLAVIGGQTLFIYKVSDFQNQNVLPAGTLKCEVNPGTYVSSLQWNPCIPEAIGIVFFDGTLIVCHVNTMQMNKLQTSARCLCWSPKGKQLVTGNSDGTLCQFKPDLVPMKTVPAPNLFEGSPVEALAIYWISTYQFAVVFKNATDDSRPAVGIVNTPKGGQPTCYNYEDICYSLGSSRPWYYFLQGIAQWNMILSSSSNSMEIATLGSTDGAGWFQWCQADEARPELPLTDKKQENYPVGMSIDTCAIHQLPWGENEVLPPMPLLHVVSQTGLLSIFNVINLNKAAPQICTPPQPLLLPANVMTSDIPGDAPAQAAAPPPTVLVVPKPQPQSVIQPQLTVSPLAHTPQLQTPQVNPPSFFAQPTMQAKAFEGTQQQSSFGFAASQPQPAFEQKQPDIKPAATLQQQPQESVTRAPPQPQSPPENDEVTAALKAEQEKANKAKIHKELTDMLVKEVNEFQMELYKFMLKTRETETRLQRDIQNINTNNHVTSVDTEKLIKDCMIDELRTSINHLKLELVRACAVVAEARSHSETKDLPQWAQADPLTAKRVDCVRKLAYYVQNQLDQARKALDIKWNEMKSNDMDNKQGKRMIRPVLDDVYQPLVKQQEILLRQQAVLKTLKNTLKDCDMGPVFKSTSILRSTPFKKDLSKLTKNIINMKIEANDKTKETQVLSSQKLDALRDILSNHKPIKVKPINVELRQQLAAMHKNYKKSLAEKVEPVKTEMSVKSEPIQIPKQEMAPPTPVIKMEPKPDIVKESPKPVYPPIPDLKPMATPMKSGLNSVARTLFTDEPKVEPELSTIQSPPQMHFVKPEQQSVPAPKTIAPTTKSLLKDLLQNKSQANANVEPKSDANTFMGQNVCSPTAFSFSKPPTAATPSAIFASNPAPNVSIFSKFQQPNVKLEPKPQPQPQRPNSSETGEPETASEKPKEEKPMTNLFGLKPSTTNVPDVLKSNTKAFNFSKLDPSKITITPIISEGDTPKENVPEKSSEIQTFASDKKENNAKPFSFQFSNKAPTGSPIGSPVIIVDFQKSADKTKSGETSPISIFSSGNASSPTSIASKPQAAATQSSILFGSAANISKSTIITPVSTPSSIFGGTTQSEEPATEIKTATGSFFTTAVTTASVFSASSQGSVFATTTTQSSLFSKPTESVFASATVKPTVFATPTTSSETEVPTTPTEKSPSAFATTSTPSSVFAAANASAFKTESTTPSLFATSTAATTTQSVFGTSTTTASVFGSTSSAQSVFSAAMSKASFGPTTTTQSIFGTATATTTQPSVFGANAATNQKSVFGATATQASVFGTSTTPSTQASVFGAATTQSPSSVFGTATTQASVFGTTTSTQASIFGTTTPTTQTSIFGAASTQASVFGTTTTTTQASIFGTPTPSTQASVFGTPTPSTQASVFGTPTQTTQASVFGTPPQTTQASVFGTPPQTTQASVFGTPTTTAQSASPFGGAETNLFAAASISTTTASNQGGGGSIFGGSSPGSVFGSSTTNVFGGKTTFGQSNPTAASIFGGGTTFGQKPATDFWSGAGNTANTGFGSTGFGQTATTQASSIFGGTTGGSFSAPSTGQPFGSPQQATFGSGEAKPSVFGSPQQGASPGFGASGGMAFGGSVFGERFNTPKPGTGFSGFNKSPGSGFGSSATFGSGATFGGTAFGSTSPGKMFGGGSSPTFAAPTQSNATFESLATQNTLTFGNLAQQSGQPQAAAPPSFNASPSFTGWRG
ncbi:uncharacterized protein Nup214 isoform X2 [Epargyreus clarus]|uniref:uncharacterized protein Nup214 isoform X2 n=1 Tax=Epargyreus clarus TaxID=520877 RepID=UPI003C301FE8